MKTLAGLLSAAGLVFTVACGQSDAGITTAVKTKLAADDTVKAYQVDVATNNQVVTLTGDVNTSAAKDRAITLARETDGVRDVIDRLEVNATAATSGLLDRDGAPARTLEPIADDAQTKTEGAGEKVADGARRTGRATADTAEKTGSDVKKGAKKVGKASADTAKSAGKATKETAKDVGEATADGAKKVGKATADTAKKVGGAVKKAVTDDDRDSDNDGK